jgi:hypothetical protein
MGRWSILRDGFSSLPEVSGIRVQPPAECWKPGQKTIVIEDCDINGFGNYSNRSGIDVKNNGGSMAGLHKSLTLRNFKLGKESGQGAQGISGSVGMWLIDSGMVYDCVSDYATYGTPSHHFYLSAGNTGSVTMRGVRSVRTRKINAVSDGHLFKCRAPKTTIEGCVFDAQSGSDPTCIIQIANGGIATITGSIIIQGATPATARAPIVYENEADSIDDWELVGRTNTLLVRGNVIISRYGIPGVRLIQVRHIGAYACVPSSQTINDNIGANAYLASSLWIDDQAGTDWNNNNSAEMYSVSDAAFTQTELYKYLRTAGAISATGGVINTRRFRYPHGSEARSDSLRGMG